MYPEKWIGGVLGGDADGVASVEDAPQDVCLYVTLDGGEGNMLGCVDCADLVLQKSRAGQDSGPGTGNKSTVQSKPSTWISLLREA